jgi:hypothetical protein
MLPSARYAHLSAVSRGKLVVSGGQHADNSQVSFSLLNVQADMQVGIRDQCLRSPTQDVDLKDGST